MEAAGIIFDDSPHYVDHLAPFCSLRNWPLIVCEPSIASLCRTFYPSVKLIESSLFEIKSLPSTVVCCSTKTALNDAFPFLGGSYRMLWLPHGQSDKGFKTPYFEALANEDLLLVYGRRMIDVLNQKKIQIATQIIGNFRYEYFQAHFNFYEKLLTQTFGNDRFLLYAPTWEDQEQSGSFCQAMPHLMNLPPSSMKIGIKPHPNTLLKFAPQIERYKGLAKEQIFFIEDFPPIYPLLSRVDAYIGDRSSIGYDFLIYKKPLFFITPTLIDPQRDQSGWLMQCGTQIKAEELPELLNTLSRFKESKKHVFAKEKLNTYVFS